MNYAGRQYDLEDLTEAIQKAKSTGEREHYEKIMYRILGESDRIRYLREELIKAMRHGETREVNKITRYIQEVRMRETNGYSWGNDKGNKLVS